MTETSRIWMVDDDIEDQMMIQEYFKDSNFRENLTFFDNGKKAIKALSELPEKSYPKLIILDLNMPILNGTQTLLEIKRDLRFRAIPVIIFSTSENDNEKRKCLSFGAVDYLVKPMSMEEGSRTVKTFVSYL